MDDNPIPLSAMEHKVCLAIASVLVGALVGAVLLIARCAQ